LSYYEHGACKWAPIGDLDGWLYFEWDGTRMAGVWEADRCIVEWADDLGLEGDARYKWLRDKATECCEVYTNWCNGWVYEYKWAAYEAEYLHGELLAEWDDYYTALEEQSCSSIYGWSDAMDSLSYELRDYGVKLT
jgi:hypothetical protein